jgi:hypothetical protein
MSDAIETLAKLMVPLAEADRQQIYSVIREQVALRQAERAEEIRLVQAAALEKAAMAKIAEMVAQLEQLTADVARIKAADRWRQILDHASTHYRQNCVAGHLIYIREGNSHGH